MPFWNRRLLVKPGDHRLGASSVRLRLGLRGDGDEALVRPLVSPEPQSSRRPRGLRADATSISRPHRERSSSNLQQLPAIRSSSPGNASATRRLACRLDRAARTIVSRPWSWLANRYLKSSSPRRKRYSRAPSVTASRIECAKSTKPTRNRSQTGSRRQPGSRTRCRRSGSRTTPRETSPSISRSQRRASRARGPASRTRAGRLRPRRSRSPAASVLCAGRTACPGRRRDASGQRPGEIRVVLVEPACARASGPASGDSCSRTRAATPNPCPRASAPDSPRVDHSAPRRPLQPSSRGRCSANSSVARDSSRARSRAAAAAGRSLVRQTGPRASPGPCPKNRATGSGRRAQR